MIFLISAILGMSWSIADQTHADLPETEMLKSLQILIQQTKNRAEKQQAALSLLQEFIQIRKKFLIDDQDKKVAKQLVTKGSELHTLIMEERLEHLFSNAFLDELTLFHHIYHKKTPSSQKL